VTSPSLPAADFIALFADEEQGALPNASVVPSTTEDWPIVIEALSRRGWPMTRRDPYRGNVDTDAAELIRRLPHLPDDDALSFAVFPHPGVQVNFFPAVGDVFFDFDRREFVDQATVDAACELIALIGDTTARPVVVAHEYDDDQTVLSYTPTLREFRLDEPWDAGLER